MARPYPKGFRDDVLGVARNYEDGVTIGQIAADFGVRPMTLSKWLPAKPRGTLDHRRAACRGVEGRVRRDRRAAEDLRLDNGPEFVSQALQQFCGGKAEMTYIPPGTPVEQRTYRILQLPPTQGLAQPQPLEHPARRPRGHLRLHARAQ
jgi:transposase-like protein